MQKFNSLMEIEDFFKIYQTAAWHKESEDGWKVIFNAVQLPG